MARSGPLVDRLSHAFRRWVGRVRERWATPAPDVWAPRVRVRRSDSSR